MICCVNAVLLGWTNRDGGKAMHGMKALPPIIMAIVLPFIPSHPTHRLLLHVPVLILPSSHFILDSMPPGSMLACFLH